MRLNWFSPLPPLRTGIAEYASFLLPALRERTELTLWTTQSAWDRSMEKYAHIRQFDPADPPWKLLNWGDASLYHIGNNPAYHIPIWEMSRKFPGVVEIHDACLQHMFAGAYRELWNDRDGYLSEISRFYGAAGRADAEQFWRGDLSTEAMSERWPLIELAAEAATGVMVHNEDAARRLRTWQANGADATIRERPVMFVPLPRATGRPLPMQRSYGPRRLTPYRLVVFGYLGVNRRLEPLIHAWGGMPERSRFVLDICGEVYDMEKVRAAIARHGLSDHVQMHGFMSEESLSRVIAKAHLAINLRFPTMGEASGSQLVLWENAMPTLVTRVGWYATIPEGAVAFVDPKSEREDIQNHLRRFLSNPMEFAEMGKRGREVLMTTHTPDQYADAVVRLTKQAELTSARIIAGELARRAGSAASPWTGALCDTRNLVSAAKEIASLVEHRSSAAVHA